jgi:NTE family protein
MNEKNYCLVLSGGGAKGVYHIGVWKALLELGIPVNAFIGNSIGAVIAAFIAGGAFDVLLELEERIGIDFIIDIPDEFISDGEISLSSGSFTAFRKFYDSLIKNKGVDTSPLKKLLVENVDENVIRNSSCDFGIITVNASDLKPCKVFPEHMPPGELLNFVMASSAFPGFTQPEIEGKHYIDGGVYDNIPFGAARARGYKKIIVSDISGIGMSRKISYPGSEMIYIKNSISMGGVLNFERGFLRDYSHLGYLDTLKTFGELGGEDYFIRCDSAKECRFRERVVRDSERFSTYIKELDCDDEGDNIYRLVESLLPEAQRYSREWLSLLCDRSAALFNIERIHLWNIDLLIEELIQQKDKSETYAREYGSFNTIDLDTISTMIKNRDNDEYNPYFFYLLIKRYLKGTPCDLALKLLYSIAPELKPFLFFLYAFNDGEGGE